MLRIYVQGFQSKEIMRLCNRGSSVLIVYSVMGKWILRISWLDKCSYGFRDVKENYGLNI